MDDLWEANSIDKCGNLSAASIRHLRWLCKSYEASKTKLPRDFYVAGTFLGALGKARSINVLWEFMLNMYSWLLLWNFPDREESSGVYIWSKPLFTEHPCTRLSFCIIPDSLDNYFELLVPSPTPNQAALTQFPCSQSRSLEPPLSPTTHTDSMDPDIGLTEKKGPTEALLPQQLPGGMRQHNSDQWEKMVGANK